MEVKYGRLREVDSGVICRISKAGKIQNEIAFALGVSQGAISKGFKGNAGKRGYREKLSRKLADELQALNPTRGMIVVGEF